MIQDHGVCPHSKAKHPSRRARVLSCSSWILLGCFFFFFFFKRPTSMSISLVHASDVAAADVRPIEPSAGQAPLHASRARVTLPLLHAAGASSTQTQMGGYSKLYAQSLQYSTDCTRFGLSFIAIVDRNTHTQRTAGGRSLDSAPSVAGRGRSQHAQRDADLLWDRQTPSATCAK